VGRPPSIKRAFRSEGRFSVLCESLALGSRQVKPRGNIFSRPESPYTQWCLHHWPGSRELHTLLSFLPTHPRCLGVLAWSSFPGSPHLISSHVQDGSPHMSLIFKGLSDPRRQSKSVEMKYKFCMKLVPWIIWYMFSV